MKPTKQLILALRETANQLLTKPEIYDWYYNDSCNCGLLAKNLLHINETEFKNILKIENISLWSNSAKNSFCPKTGLPFTEIFKLLYEAGLEKEDFRKIEFIEGGSYKNLIQVAEWMNKKADELEERRINENKR